MKLPVKERRMTQRREKSLNDILSDNWKVFTVIGFMVFSWFKLEALDQQSRIMTVTITQLQADISAIRVSIAILNDHDGRNDHAK